MLIHCQKTNPRPLVLQSSALPTELILPRFQKQGENRLFCFPYKREVPLICMIPYRKTGGDTFSSHTLSFICTVNEKTELPFHFARWILIDTLCPVCWPPLVQLEDMTRFSLPPLWLVVYPEKKDSNLFYSEKVLHEYFEKHALKHRNISIIYQA